MAGSGSVARSKPRVLSILAAIPAGRVTTYGSIARYLHIGPREVARILSTLTAEESRRLPWFRVVGANGVISSVKRRSVGRRQIERLRAEGIAVTPQNKVEDFRVVAWSPAVGSIGDFRRSGRAVVRGGARCQHRR
jgi:methylated-DNA-protein-cysteine methyltransferase related protein